MLKMKIMAILSGWLAVMAAGTVVAASLDAASPTVVLVAGHTVEIPISSTLPIASDLTASGAFQAGDVTFTDGPGCHLSAHGCTLLVKAAANSHDYTAVPVSVRASSAIPAVFALTVIQPGESAPVNAKLAELILTPLPAKPQTVGEDLYDSPAVVSDSTSPVQAPLQRSGNSLFYGVAEAHPALSTMAKDAHSHFTANTNGPVYQIVTLTNNDATQALSMEITGAGANSFSIDNDVTHYGVNHNCAAMTAIATGDSCLVIVKGKVGDPAQAPQTALLTIQGDHGNQASFTLATTTYVYAAGGFNTLGDASVTSGDLLAECTAGTCSNALQGTTGSNNTTTHFSVGQWINALSVTPAGNLMVGGVFGAIGGATSGATSGTAALLAQCTPGSVSGNACINQIGSSGSPYALSNAYIDAITAPFLISSTNYIAVGGDFSQIRGTTTVGGKMLAKCVYTGTSAVASCSNYLTGSGTNYANAAISAVDYLNSSVNVGGLLTQIKDYPSSAPSTGTTFASCTTSACNQGMSSNNPNNSILGITNDGTSLYMGGVFTSIGSYTDSNGGYPLVVCALGSPTICSNALSGSNDADGYIEGLSYSGGDIYVGGQFTTIGGVSRVIGGNMLAVCTVGSGSTCSNFVNGTHNYASGDDWGGNISAVAVGNQTTITAN